LRSLRYLQKLFHHEEHEEKKKLKHETLDAVSQSLDVEVDQQSRRYAGKFHVCEQLSLVDARYLFHTLQLQDVSVLDEQVDSIPAVEANFLVFDRKGPLHLWAWHKTIIPTGAIGHRHPEPFVPQDKLHEGSLISVEEILRFAQNDKVISLQARKSILLSLSSWARHCSYVDSSSPVP
jgi:hypothetical protein